MVYDILPRELGSGFIFYKLFSIPMVSALVFLYNDKGLGLVL